MHGIPSTRQLRDGDIVSIDIGVKQGDWCADAAVTWPVGDVSDENMRLLHKTEDILRYAIKALAKKTRWSHIARKMQSKTESQQSSIVRDLVGHGIGKTLWEHPQIPNYYERGLDDFRIRQGAVLAIEPMIATGIRIFSYGHKRWRSRKQCPWGHVECYTTRPDKSPHRTRKNGEPVGGTSRIFPK